VSLEGGAALVMLVVTAYQERLALVAVAAALLAGAITARLAQGRRWYDSLATFLLLTLLLTVVVFLAVHVLMELPVAEIEVVSF